MKLFLKLAGVLFTFFLLLLSFTAPKPVQAATACQLIVSTTEVVAHGSFNVTIQNGVDGTEYAINYDAAFFRTVFTMTASGSFTTTVNLDEIFGAASPQASSGSFLVTAGTTAPLGLGGGPCDPAGGILITVIAPPTPTITSFTADKNPVDYNTSTNLNWVSTNADTCTINGTTVATSGTQPTGNLTTPTTFTLVCTNVSGSATATITVNVNSPPPVVCSPATQTVLVGQVAKLSASGGDGTFAWTASGGSPATGSGTPFSTTYSSTGTKTVTVTSAGLNANCSVTVNAPPPTPTPTPPPTPCSYDFSPTTVDEGGLITVTIRSGNPTHQFFASIDSLTPPDPGAGTRIGLGDIVLKAPNVPVDTTYLVGARDDVSKNLCALTPGYTNTLTVKAIATWHLDLPNVTADRLHVLFSFTPASNGYIGLVVAPRSGDVCNWVVLPRPFDSGPIASGTNQVTWNFPPPGDYCAQLVFGAASVSNTQPFSVLPPAGDAWTLSVRNCYKYKVIFGISPNAGSGSVIHINKADGTTLTEINIDTGASSVVWDAPQTPANYKAVIIYFTKQVSNPITFDVPCAGDATIWTMYVASVLNGNDVIFNVQCPTKDCPGINGEATVAIKDLDGLSQPVPKGGGIVRFNALPNGSHQAVVVVFLSEMSGVVDFTLPQNNTCGWLAFPGGAGVVQGPIKNCAIATPGKIISAILPYIFGIAGFLSVIVIVISGIQFITSSGNPEAAAGARNRLIFALIGLAIIILAFAFLQIIDKLFLGGTGVS